MASFPASDGRTYCARTAIVNAVVIIFSVLRIVTASPPPNPAPAPLANMDPTHNLSFQKNLPARVVWGAPGMDVELPCDVTPPPGDRVNMVLWFKDSDAIPLYSLDNRKGDLDHAEHGAISRPRGATGRYYFLTSSSGVPIPPSGPRVAAHNRVGPPPQLDQLSPSMGRLRIMNVSHEDEGMFRCRVDFLNTPTTNSRVNLTLATPPSPPIITNAQGLEVGPVAGPFLEGLDLQLTCSVTGGFPRPEVSWWMGDHLLDDYSETKASSETINKLRLETVTRHHLNAILQCRAAPLPGAPPQVKEVALEVYLKPHKVEIVSPKELVPAGRPRKVDCVTSGSFPAAYITWLLDGEPIRNSAVSVSDSQHATKSSLTITAAAADNGRELACRAENPRFPGGFLEDRRLIEVSYPPIVSISLVSNKPPENLTEGDEVKFRCDVKANPQVDRLTWYHGNTLLRTDAAEVAGRRFLSVKPLVPSSSGKYSCAASNKEGTGTSESKTITVRFAPRCREGFVNRRLGALIGETLEVKCELLAEPVGNDFRFSWTFSNSSLVSSIPAHLAVSNGTTSILKYNPKTDADFGTLSCWGVNSVGPQTTPCQVNVIPAKPPQRPEACKVRNRTVSSLSPGTHTSLGTPTAASLPEMEVRCSPGADGGMRQHFLLELYAVPDLDKRNGDTGADDEADEDKSNEINGLGDAEIPHSSQGGRVQESIAGSEVDVSTTSEVRAIGTRSRGVPLRRLLGPEPTWTLHSLEPGRLYEILLFAVNDKGRSEPAVVVAASAPAGPEYFNGIEVRRSMSGQPPSDALSSGVGIQTQQSPPVAVVLGALIACAALILGAVVCAILVVCRRRNESSPDTTTEDFREAVRSSQVVVGSLTRHPVTPGEEDAFGILVTATSPNSSVVGIRDGGAGVGTGMGTATLPRAALTAARPTGTQDDLHLHQRGRALLHDPGGVPGVPHISGGGLLNRIRNNNDPDLIISRAEVVLKPLNTSRC